MHCGAARSQGLDDVALQCLLNFMYHKYNTCKHGNISIGEKCMCYVKRQIETGLGKILFGIVTFS